MEALQQQNLENVTDRLPTMAAMTIAAMSCTSLAWPLVNWLNRAKVISPCDDVPVAKTWDSVYDREEYCCEFHRKAPAERRFGSLVASSFPPWFPHG